MNYSSVKEQSLNQYETLKAQYDEKILSESFEKIKSEIIFDILKCRYLSDILQIYKNIDGDVIPKINFKSGEEAKDIFLNLIQFKRIINTLLDNVAYLDSVITLKNKLNRLVREDDYLSDSLLIPSLGRIEMITKDCLRELPEYQNHMTKEFKYHFIETCINSLPDEELNVLVENRIIRPADLDNIRISYNDFYDKKINYLCNILGHQPMAVITIPTKIKGTTFPNDDGSSRQTYLKELEIAIKDEKNPPILTVEQYIYKPEVGAEEPAAKIMWGDKQLGNIDKAIVKDITENYMNPQYQVSIKYLGQKDGKYGCQIELTVKSPRMITKESEMSIEK